MDKNELSGLNPILITWIIIGAVKMKHQILTHPFFVNFLWRLNRNDDWFLKPPLFVWNHYFSNSLLIADYFRPSIGIFVTENLAN